MRLAILTLLAATICRAQQTTVNGPLYSNASSTLLDGLVKISWPAFTVSGHAVAPGSTTITVVAGAFSVPLWPTEGAAPATQYSVAYYLNGGQLISTERWSVPASSPTTVAIVRGTVSVPGIGVTAPNVAALFSGTRPCYLSGDGTCAAGGSGSGGGVNTVAFSATPVFDLSLGQTQTMVLASNVTSPSFINAAAGYLYTFAICQGGSGGNNFAWGAGWHSPMRVGAIANKCSVQLFTAINSTTLLAVAPGMLDI